MYYFGSLSTLYEYMCTVCPGALEVEVPSGLSRRVTCTSSGRDRSAMDLTFKFRYLNGDPVEHRSAPTIDKPDCDLPLQS